MKDKFVREVDPTGASLSMLDGRTAGIREINEQASPSSLLSRKRMVVIEDVFQNKGEKIFEELIELLKTQEKNDNILIFWDSSVKTGKKENILFINSAGEEKPLGVKPLKLFKYLAKQKFAQEFKGLSNVEAAGWVKKETEARGAQITLPAANLLVSLAGTDLWQINNEISKLVNYKSGLEPQIIKGGQKIVIEEKDVEELVRGNFDEDIFALTDAVSAKNKALAARLLEEQFTAGLSDVYLLTMITRQFNILLQIRQALDKNETQRKMQSDLKLHPYVLQKGAAQARNFTLAQLKNILSRLIEMDYLMKTGRGDIQTMLSMLFARI
jgi:DNA polymerase-3 subunit delta